MPSMATGLRWRPDLVVPVVVVVVVTLAEVALVRPIAAAPGGVGLVAVAVPALVGLVVAEALGVAVLVLVITFDGSVVPPFLLAKNLSPGVAFLSAGFFSTVVAVVRLLGREDDLLLLLVDVAETVVRFPEWTEIASINDEVLVVDIE